MEAIRAVLVRYATAIDTRDWSLLRSCFTTEATADYGDMGGEFASVDELVAFMETAHAAMGPTNHMLSNFVIEIEGNEARASTYVHAVLAAPDDPSSWIDAVGRYEDRLVHADDGWRIAFRQFRVTRLMSST
jgi:3-phenylpropionate/cinnamic acid dioxygenase small subunit